MPRVYYNAAQNSVPFQNQYGASETPMFLIAGISPKTKVLDNHPKRCPMCGLIQAYYKRVDHYFNIFFIPILRVKKGEPFLMCDRCEKTVHEFKEEYDRSWSDIKEVQCHHCGKSLKKDFDYCPYCGKHISK